MKRRLLYFKYVKWTNKINKNLFQKWRRKNLLWEVFWEESLLGLKYVMFALKIVLW